MKYISRVIYEDNWTFYLTPTEDNVIIDESSEAEADFHTKEIWFRESNLSLETVIHEITHLFFGYTFTSAANLDAHAFEEIACELFSYKGKLILSISNEIYLELVKLKNGK
jgi:hypothetical protein